MIITAETALTEKENKEVETMRRVRSGNPKAKGSGGVVLSAVGTAPRRVWIKAGCR